ncbi:G2 and S phase-expressed protein 1 isoform X2 [Oryctolagus cuniculus]|uniref:G2 and S phase-expressed protein 1 isoform X2 n=1 Tax=Oryctolagus cuniculus TaxID=9986 RepID=UPI002231A9B2|nr:G2 and S phase-expressed protein 1 isoform X4 [Oryctolagus cuniculus]
MRCWRHQWLLMLSLGGRTVPRGPSFFPAAVSKQHRTQPRRDRLSRVRGPRARRRPVSLWPAGEAQMDVPEEEGILLLTDEKFDFDLSLSSSSANEDDEVFFGPVGHKERCIAASLELNKASPGPPPLPASGGPFAWSPLAGEKFVEVYKEARLLALQIESSSRNRAAHMSKPQDAGSLGVERFLQESQLKVSLFEKEKEKEKSPKSLKRETYYLSNSPLVGPLLLDNQPSMSEAPRPTRPSSAAQVGPVQSQGPLHSSRPWSGQPGAAHPPNQAVAQKRVPSKLQLPRASSSVRGKSLHSATEKLKKELPTSPSKTKTLKGKEPCREAPPDQPGMALDTASLPASGSHLVQGKRLLSVPPKSGLRKSLLKPPGCNLARKSSSSGSVSSEMSGACVSPAVGKAKRREFTSVPAHSSLPLSNTGKLGRTGPKAPHQSLPAAGTDIAECTTEQPTVPTTAAATQPQTPGGRDPRLDSNSILSESSQLNKTGSIRRRDSHLNSATKVMPTPTNPFKIPKSSIGGSPDGTTPKFSRTQRPQSCVSAGRAVVHSTPVRCSLGLASPGLASSSRPPLSSRRMSSLPTPTGRRLSSLAWDTPKTVPRALVSPLPVPTRRLSSEPRKKSAVRTEPTTTTWRADSEPGARSPEGRLSPHPSAVPQALNFSPEKSDFTLPKSTSTEATLDEAKSSADARPGEALLVDIRLDQLTITMEAESRALCDRPLIDFCSTPEGSVALGSESRPLIDLMTNTPDLSGGVPSKPSQVVGQLIDLSSPLIQLSPAADKENVDSPLLKF